MLEDDSSSSDGEGTGPKEVLSCARLPYALPQHARSSKFSLFRERCAQTTVSARSGFIGKSYGSGSVQVAQNLSIVSRMNHPRNKLSASLSSPGLAAPPPHSDSEEEEEALGEYITLPLHEGET